MKLLIAKAVNQWSPVSINLSAIPWSLLRPAIDVMRPAFLIGEGDDVAGKDCLEEGQGSDDHPAPAVEDEQLEALGNPFAQVGDRVTGFPGQRTSRIDEHHVDPLDRIAVEIRAGIQRVRDAIAVG